MLSAIRNSFPLQKQRKVAIAGEILRFYFNDVEVIGREYIIERLKSISGSKKTNEKNVGGMDEYYFEQRTTSSKEISCFSNR